MIYPGYLLNPGDMFQVDPDRVMFATGEPKALVAQRTRRALRVEKQRRREQEKARALREEAEKAKLEEGAEQEQELTTGRPEETKKQPEAEGESQDSASPTDSKKERSGISIKRKAAQDRIKAIIAKGKEILSAKKKQDLRAKIAEINEIAKTATTLSNFESALEPIMSELKAPEPPKPQNNSSRRNQDNQEPNSSEVSKQDNENNDDEGGGGAYKTVEERNEITRVVAALEELRDNPFDLTKPYATPWKPRPWMSPFVFIPRYLEVNQNICAAVYLRHPVARPGLAEVPSPFGAETGQLAFNWYLRRR